MTVADLETLGAGQPDETPTETCRPRRSPASRRPASRFERLRKDKVAIVCAAVVALLVLLGVFAPLICKLWGIKPDDAPTTATRRTGSTSGYPTVGPPFHGFTWEHPLGLSTNTAYDNLARLLYGLRTSLFIARPRPSSTTLIGVVVGLVAGFARGALDRIISFVIDVFLSFPFILGALALAPIIIGRFADQPDELSRRSSSRSSSSWSSSAGWAWPG